MANTTQRYPLATPDGVPIPLEVIRPLGAIRKAIALTVSTAVSIASNVEIASFYATVDCFVNFGGTASVSGDGVTQSNSIFIPAGSRITCAVMAVTFTVIGVTDVGFLYVQLIDNWAGLTLQTKFTGGN